MKFYKPKGLVGEQREQFAELCEQNYAFAGSGVNPIIYISGEYQKENEEHTTAGMGCVVAETKNTLIIATAAHCIKHTFDSITLMRKTYAEGGIISALKETLLGEISPFKKKVRETSLACLGMYSSPNSNEDLGFIVAAKSATNPIQPFILEALSEGAETLAFAIRNMQTTEGAINLRSGFVTGKFGRVSGLQTKGEKGSADRSDSKGCPDSVPYTIGDFYGNHSDFQQNKGLHGQSGSPVFLANHCFGLHVMSLGFSKHQFILPARHILARLEKILPQVENRFG